MAAAVKMGAKDLDQVDAALPASIFVLRGHIRDALGLTRREFNTLLSNGVFVAKYPFGKKTRARFLRAQVIAVARSWQD